jgi:hypothetical protein
MGGEEKYIKILVENASRGREHTGNHGAYESIKLKWNSDK